MKEPLPVNPPVCNQADSGGGRTRTSGVSLSQIYSLLPSPLGHTTGASLLPVTVRCIPCPIHLYPQTVSLHKLMGDGSGSWSCRESNSDLACCQPLLAVTCVEGFIPTCVGKVIRGRVRSANPARLVDDVHILAGRIHRPTVRPVRFKFSDSSLLIGNGGWNRVSHCEGETVKRNVVGVWGLIPACTGKVLVMGLLTVAPISLQHVANGFQQAIANLSAPMIWVGWREQQPFNPCLYCCHLAGVAYDPRSCPHAHAG